MVKHVVCWRFKPEFKSQIDPARRRLLAMKTEIPEIVDLEVGRDFLASPRSFDLVLTVTLADRQALVTYGDHPKHQPVKEFIGPLYEAVAVVDYEV